MLVGECNVPALYSFKLSSNVKKFHSHWGIRTPDKCSSCHGPTLAFNTTSFATSIASLLVLSLLPNLQNRTYPNTAAGPSESSRPGYPWSPITGNLHICPHMSVPWLARELHVPSCMKPCFWRLPYVPHVPLSLACVCGPFTIFRVTIQLFWWTTAWATPLC